MNKKLLLLFLVFFLSANMMIMNVSQAESAKFNMTYLNYGTTSTQILNVDTAKGSLQVVSPSYFGLNADGSLRLSEGVDSAFVKAMHDRNIKVVPFLSNDWSRDLGTKAMQNSEQLSSQIADAIKQYNLDGVNVDIENLTAAERDLQTDLVKKLRAKLPSGTEVSVAIVADPNGAYGTGAYDLKAMSAYVDYFMLMAYDEHYPGDPISGPVASEPFVEKSIQQALKLVPANKLVLGIPFYGRFWNGDPVYDGRGISNQIAEKLMDYYHGTKTYDETNQSVKGVFTIGNNDSPFTIGGKPFPPGNYTIWYEDAQSIKAKLMLIQKYNLKGSGSWSLEQSTAETWDYYSLWLNGKYFTDMEGHWAQSDVLNAYEKNWMQGVTDTLFAPDQPLTRAQAAVVLARAFGFDSSTDVSQQSLPFTDVPASHWAQQEIAYAVKKGYVQGMTDTTFAPDAPLTREQLSQLLVRVLSLPQALQNTQMSFSDVSKDRWSYAAIASMYEKQLVVGFDDNTFRPQSLVTRAQMAVLLGRMNP